MPSRVRNPGDRIMHEEIIVGKHGEILPKKALRHVAGIFPGDKVLVEAFPNKIVINKILSIDEIFNLPVLARQSPDEIESELHDEETRLEVDTQ
jgi:hypothetical protein